MGLTRTVIVGAGILLMTSIAQAEPLKLEVKEAKAAEHWVTGRPTVEFALTERSAREFWEFSKKNIEKRMIFRVDGRDVTQVWIMQELPAGRGVLDAQSPDEAAALAKLLMSGEAVFEVIEDQSNN
jgi:preprotein translocase subunit SecD